MPKKPVRGQEQGQRPPVQEEDQHPQPGGVDYIDYKDVNLLRRFMSDRAKIRARRVTGNDAQQQREVALAIKNAREMALLPYANRVTTQRPLAATVATAAIGATAGCGPTGRRPVRPRRRPAAVALDVGDRRGRRSTAMSSRRRGGRGVKVILRADVADVGHKGDIVDVADGFARNYLVPKGLAMRATKGSEAQAASMKRARDVKDARDRGAAEEVATRLVPA